jgi:anti-anti-sigma factor
VPARRPTAPEESLVTEGTQPHELARATVSREGATTTVGLTGEIDMSNADQLRAQITAASADREPLVVDLTALRFLDSAGIAMLGVLHQECAQRHVDLTIRAARDSAVFRTLHLAGMDQVLPVSVA